MITARESLTGVNALTDTNPNNYALFAEQDNVLLKEHSRGALSAGGNVTHNLGYIPFYLVYGDIGGGTYRLGSGWDPISLGHPRSRTTPDVLKTAQTDCKYFIFYNNMD